MNPKNFLRSLILLLLIMCCTAIGFAQSGTTTIRGTVLDAQGQAITGATLTLSNNEKNFSRTITSNASGGYVFNTIPPGTYRIEVEAKGFKKGIITDVAALVDTASDMVVKLEVGDVTEVVTISSSAEAPINTTDATIGNAFEGKRIIDLPLNARNIVGLLSLQPGVTKSGEVNGGRRDQANITLDGVDTNEQQSGLDVVSGEAFASVLRSTPDSVQEFRVTTANPNANQGRSSGAQVSLVTRSGTSQFHGSLYEYHRNTITTANDFFAKAQGRYVATDSAVLAGRAKAGDERSPRPKLIRNVFGGALGGPLPLPRFGEGGASTIRDKAFFFYNYEGRRDASEVRVVRIVPTASLRQGQVRFPNIGGGTTTLTTAQIAQFFPETGGVNTVGLQFLQTAPLPNSTEQGDGLNTAAFAFNASTPVKLGLHTARLDFNLTSQQTLFLRGIYQNDKYGRAPQFPTTLAPNQWVHPFGYVVGHTWTINNSLTNSFRAGITRQAFSLQGDSGANAITFRFVYEPYAFSRTVSRTTPVWNYTDDLTWVKGNHTAQFGTNIRTIRNGRTSFANSFDTARVNPSFYAASGAVLTDPLTRSTSLLPEAQRPTSGSLFDTRAAVAAVLGRLSDYSASVVYDKAGNILPSGTPTVRSFATEEYDFYAQDFWKIRPNLTITYGLRYGLNTPVYEQQGYQARPTISLGELFDKRVKGAEAGTPNNDLITVDLAGKANGKPGFYAMDKNNWAPSIAVAWSPDFGDNFFGRLVGRNGKSSIRAGFRTLYDRIGSALAVNFDLNNTLGFTSSTAISANTFNVTSRLGPQFTGLSQDVRSLPRLTLPGKLSFPLSKSANEAARIERTIDDSLVTPNQYMWNLSYGRELKGGMSFEVNYIGRLGRNLLAARDIMHLNNLKDAKSGQTWYQAAGILADLHDKGLSFDGTKFTGGTVPSIPFFENLYPGNRIQLAAENYFGFNPGDLNFMRTLTASQQAAVLIALGDGGFSFTDWTSVQDLLDDFSTLGRNAYFHPQYAALAAYSTIGVSDYHGFSASLRQRFKNDLFFDLNYTFAKSLDTTSTLESTQDPFSGGLIRNPLDIKLARSYSNYDSRHVINANWSASLPFGKGKKFFSNMPAVANIIFGGWQLTGVYRFNSGLPISVSDVGLWATNWNFTSRGVRLKNIQATPTKNGLGGQPNLFSNPLEAYKSFRNARAGEEGDRNVLRTPGYWVIDSGLYKTFKMPYAEKHELQFRWEVYNVTNTQHLGAIETLGLNQDPFNASKAATGFGRFIGEQTPAGESRPGRVMQFALRYQF